MWMREELRNKEYFEHERNFIGACERIDRLPTSTKFNDDDQKSDGNLLRRSRVPIAGMWSERVEQFTSLCGANSHRKIEYFVWRRHQSPDVTRKI